jgi:hypothetical protein
MPKYSVLLHGKGGVMNISERRWLLFNKITERRTGFYTTRFVEAISLDEAAKKAILMVRDEIQKLYYPKLPWTIVAEEIIEVDAELDENLSGAGFTFYPEEDII